MPLRALLQSQGVEQGEGKRVGGELIGERILVPLVAAERSPIVDQINVGMAIATATGGSIRIEAPITDDAPGHRTITPTANIDLTEVPIEWALERAHQGDSGRVDGILAARRIERQVRERVRHEEADTLILPRPTDDSPLSHRRLRRLAAEASCSVIWVNGEPGYREFASILLPIADGPHSGLATDVAGAIAKNVDAYVDILHVLAPEASVDSEARAERRLETALERIDIGDRANPWILREDDPVGAIVEQSRYYGLTVVGAPSSGRLKQFVYGSTSRTIRNQSDNMVIAARNPAINR